MKAVDLVLQGSTNSKQAKERARALVALFHSDWLPSGSPRILITLAFA